MADTKRERERSSSKYKSSEPKHRDRDSKSQESKKAVGDAKNTVDLDKEPENRENEATLEPFVLDQSNEGHRDVAMSMLYEYQQQGLYTDFKINVRGEIIHCHRNVLSASCPYFESLFRSRMQEAQDGELKTDVADYETMKCIVQYVYSKKMFVEWKNIEKIIEACDRLQIPQLKMELGQHISEQLTAKNCIAWKNFALKYNIPELFKNAKHVMATNIEELCEGSDFQNFTQVKLYEYLNSKETVIRSRDYALKAVVLWIKYDPENRKKLLNDLLKEVRLKECSPAAVRKLVTEYKDLITEPMAKELIYEAVVPLWETTTATAEETFERKLIIMGGVGNNRCLVTWNFLEDERWKDFASIPVPYDALCSPICVLPDGFAVLCMGENHNENVRFTARTKSWSNLPVTPIDNLEKSSVVYSNNFIYLIGGEHSEAFHFLNLESMIWTKGPSLPWKQMWPIAACLGDDLFVVYNSNNFENQFHGTTVHFSQNTGTWEYKARLPPSAPGTHGASIVSKPSEASLYLIGGIEMICAQYKPAFDSWTLLRPPYYRHNYGSAAMSGKLIYLGGGYNAKEVEEYNTEEHCWQNSSLRLPTELPFFTTAVVSFL